MKNKILRTRLASDQAALWYLGQVGFVIAAGGTRIAVDPYLSDYVDQNCPALTTPWRRLYAPPAQGEELDFLDAVLCTHGHVDHADPWTLPRIAHANPNTVFVAPAPEVDRIARMGIAKERIIPAFADRPLTVGTFTVTPIPAAHEVLHTDGEGNYMELSYLIDCGVCRILHGGDTCLYDGMVERLTDVDVAILPINGRDYFKYTGDVIGNMNSIEAITLAQRIGADLLIPVHHDLYDANRVSAAGFVDTLMRYSPTQKYHVFAPGERYIYAKE